MLEELIDAFLTAAVIPSLPRLFIALQEAMREDADCKSLVIEGEWANADGQCSLRLWLKIRRYNTLRLIETFDIGYVGPPCFTDLDSSIQSVAAQMAKVARRNRFRADGQG